MENHYTYVILDPTKPDKYQYPGLKMCFLFEPFYVGKGQDDRIFEHIRDAKRKNGKNKRKRKRIKEILSVVSEEVFRTFHIKYKEHVSEPIAMKLETKIITNVGRIIENNKGPLTNIMIKGWKMPSEIAKAASLKASATKKRRGSAKSGAKKGVATRKRRGTATGGASGTRNSQARKFLIIEPNGIKHIVHGGVIPWIKEHNLSISLFTRWLNKGPITKVYIKKCEHMLGWSFQHI